MDRPIIFSAPMVRALLDGRKTQTRRVLKPQPAKANMVGIKWPDGTLDCNGRRLPYAPGDRLWVREAFSLHNAHGQQRADGKRWGPWSGLPTRVSPDGKEIVYYREGFDRCDPGRWRPSIHMPRWASRLTLHVTAVRVQRLQDISEEDARAEGILYVPGHGDIAPADLAEGYANFVNSKMGFEILWDDIYGAGAWDANPWVAAITFTVERANIDALRPAA